MRALLIRSPHIDKILSGKKVWEIRGARTHVRGPVGLIRSGSGSVIGVCDIVDCYGPLTAEQYRKNARKAGTTPREAILGTYQQTFAWVIKNPRHLKAAIPYKHPNGAIIWVTLDAKTEKAVLRAQKG